MNGSKKRKPSEAWNHFNLYGEASAKRVKCNHCDADYKYTGNTTSLLNHLKSSHKDKLNASSQSLTIEFSQKKNQAACFDLTELICVQGFGFRLISKCRIIKDYIYQKYGIKLDSPNIVREHVMCFARFIITKQKEYIIDLKKKSFKFAIIIDEAKLTNHIKIIGLKLKIINGSTLNLGIIKIDKRSTALNILECIKTKLNVYGINLNEVLVLISDGSKTSRLVAGLMDISHQMCYAHLVQFIINDEIYNKSKVKSVTSSNIDESSNDSYRSDEYTNDQSSEDIDDDYENAVNLLENDPCIDHTDYDLQDDLHESANLNLGESEDVLEDELISFIANDENFKEENYNDEIELNQNFKQLVQNVGQILKWFGSSVSRLNALKKYTNKVLDCQVKLKSLYSMLNQFLEMVPHMKKAFADLSEDDLTNNVNLNALRTIVNSFEVLYDAKSKLSKEDCNFETAVNILDYSIELFDNEITMSPLSQKLKNNLKLKKRKYQTIHYHIYKALTDLNYETNSIDEDFLIHSISSLYKKLKQCNENSSSELVELIESLLNNSNLDNAIPNLNCLNNLEDNIKNEFYAFKLSGNLSCKLEEVLDFVKQIPATSGAIERLNPIADLICKKFENCFDGTMLNCILILRAYFKQKNDSQLIFHIEPKKLY